MLTKFIFFSSLIFAQVSFAGFPPRTNCSNQGGTINFDLSAGTIKVLVSKSPDKYILLNEAEVDVDNQVIQEMKDETYGCTARKVDFRHLAITKKDGSVMPDAYNRLVQNGSLNDYFICVKSQAWMPAPGKSCK